MGVWRCESPGARVGDLACISDGSERAPEEEPRLRGRSGVSRKGLPQADAELHLVGEPKGYGGTQYLSGRLSWPGQYRGVRQERAAADGRVHQPVRRDQLDGD